MTPDQVLMIFADVLAQTIEKESDYCMGDHSKTNDLLQKCLASFNEMKTMSDAYAEVNEALVKCITARQTNLFDSCNF